MALKGYTTEEIIENYILQNIDSSFSSQIDAWIEDFEKFIDNYTGRNFKADTSASARLFDGDGSQDLLIDEAVTITKVEVGQDSYGGTFSEVGTTGSDKYLTYPENASVKGYPIYKLVLNARRWSEGLQNNRITAKWGYSVTVPADITFVTTVLVAGVLNQHRQGGDEIKSEKIGNYQVTYNTDSGNNSFADLGRAMEMLDMYKKLRI
jgi:hypothetical protein